jgi:FKBP-type peptidyl-prolyl cis-trans isomerase SlyD
VKQKKSPLVIEDDIVVSMDYKLKVDDEIVDSSEDTGPIQFLQGSGEIIPGLERELYGMMAGDRKQITVASEDAYGDVDPDEIQEISIFEFPREIPLEPGLELEMEDEDGHVEIARVVDVGEFEVKLDFNHPLAGKELHFEIEIVGLRPATEEEIEHGHVHVLGEQPPDHPETE